jgi:tRNA threonylcarbamoyladenosine biosynthesis protein TsaE
MTNPGTFTWEGEIAEERDTLALAGAFAPLLRAGDLLVLSGGLGAGKTFFSRALLYSLGLDPEEPVTSPTFTLAQEYPTVPPVVHADLYRLTEEEEVLELGLDVRRGEGFILVVEWGAPFVKALGGEALFLELSVEPRHARVFGVNPRSQEIIVGLRRVFPGAAPSPAKENDV